MQNTLSNMALFKILWKFLRALSVEGIGTKVCGLRRLENRIEAGSDFVCK